MDRTTATALVRHQVEVPSWAFRGSDVRFQSQISSGAPQTPFEMLADAAVVREFTGIAGSVALHLPADRTENYRALAERAAELGITIGSVHPEVNQRQGRPPAVCHSESWVRAKSVEHLIDCAQVAGVVGAERLTLRFVDDTPYPGKDELEARQERLRDALRQVSRELPTGVRLVLEYTVVEPCFYTMDVPDWGTAYSQCLQLGPDARVLVDTGPYAQGRHSDFVVDLLRRDDRLGGVVFLSPSDDTADPFDLFLAMAEVVQAGGDTGVPFVLDPGVNSDPDVLSVMRSVLAIQRAAAQVSTVDFAGLSDAQVSGDTQLVHELLVDAFRSDVEPALVQARERLGAPADPVAAYYEACRIEFRDARRRAGRRIPETAPAVPVEVAVEPPALAEPTHPEPMYPEPVLIVPALASQPHDPATPVRRPVPLDNPTRELPILDLPNAGPPAVAPQRTSSPHRVTV